MRIGELARAAGVSTKTIRYYESIGLIPEPARLPNGYRNYEADAADRLEFVRDAQAGGLTLTEIAAVLDQRDRGDATCTHVISLLESHLMQLDARIRHLGAMRDNLVALTDRARSLDHAACTDPNRCHTIARRTAEPIHSHS